MPVFKRSRQCPFSWKSDFYRRFCKWNFVATGDLFDSSEKGLVFFYINKHKIRSCMYDLFQGTEKDFIASLFNASGYGWFLLEFIKHAF